MTKARIEIKTVTIENVDIDLLREQRNTLISLCPNFEFQEEEEHIDGIVNFLDKILDIAEEY